MNMKDEHVGEVKVVLEPDAHGYPEWGNRVVWGDPHSPPTRWQKMLWWLKIDLPEYLLIAAFAILPNVLLLAIAAGLLLNAWYLFAAPDCAPGVFDRWLR